MPAPRLNPATPPARSVHTAAFASHSTKMNLPRHAGVALIWVLLCTASARADNSALLVPLYECHGRELHTTLARQCAADHPQLAEQTGRVLQDWIKRNDARLTELARNCKADFATIGDACQGGPAARRAGDLAAANDR